MAVYLVSFALSILLIAFGEKKRLPVFLGISAIALLIPCLVAGLRDLSIGTDVLVYVKPMTNAAYASKNIFHFFDGYWFAQWRNLYVQDYEIGFSLVVYLVSKLTHSLGAVLFVIEALMVVPIYIALARNRKNFPVWLGMLVFYLLFYNATLNMMRQWIAMSFLLLSFQMLRERRFLLTGLFLMIGILFHTTAIMGIPLYLLYWVLWLVRRKQFVHHNLQIECSTVVSLLLMLLAVVMIRNLPVILKLLSAIGLGAYGSYLEGNDIGLMLGQIVLRLPLLGILMLNWRQFRRKDPSAAFYLCVVLVDIVLSQLVSVDDNALRISSYLMLFSIMWIPSVSVASPSKPKRVLTTALVIVFALFYWYYTYVLTMRHSTYPYFFRSII